MRHGSASVVLCLAAACFQIGCAWLGPSSIRSGRSAYNEAIIATDSEQLLDTIVRMRYGEPSSMLLVSSITASMHVGATGGAQFGFGRANNYATNLIPLSVGGDYEDNPTITYAPLQGEKYLRQLLSPVPLDVTLLMLGAFEDSPQVIVLLIRTINGVQNPSLAPGATVPLDTRFAQIAELLAELARGGHVEWVMRPEATPTFSLVLEGDGGPYVRQVVELYRLLGLTPPPKIGHVTRIPISNEAGEPDAIVLRPRSLYELFDVAAGAVEVPDEHVAAGVVPERPVIASAGPGIHIHCSASEPEHAMTAVEHNGYWYSIDASDHETKLAFRVLAALMSVQLADDTDRESTQPMLTVPVSR